MCVEKERNLEPYFLEERDRVKKTQQMELYIRLMDSWNRQIFERFLDEKLKETVGTSLVS